MSEKKYANLDYYSNKLNRIMKRFGIDESKYNWNCDRFGGWVEFTYKGQLYRFEHSVKQAKEAGVNITYGSDAFAQIVLALEDLARIVERGIYDLQNWVAGMKALPEQATLPSFCAILGLTRLPESKEEVHTQFKKMAKIFHPDSNGTEADFQKLNDAKEQAIAYLESTNT